MLKDRKNVPPSVFKSKNEIYLCYVNKNILIQSNEI